MPRRIHAVVDAQGEGTRTTASTLTAAEFLVINIIEQLYPKREAWDREFRAISETLAIESQLEVEI